MLTSAFEWERLIHPNPTDDMIAQRKAIVGSLLKLVDEEKNLAVILQFVSAALTGLSPAVTSDVEFGEVLTNVTKKHHQAFPSSLNENALDLQLSACLAIGELLTRPKSKGGWNEARTALASASLGAVGLLPSGAGLHLKVVQDFLLAKAHEELARRSKAVRQRPNCDLEELKELTPSGDAATMWNQVKPVLESVLESITRASAIDRDELEVLWWLYNAESVIFAKQLSGMSAFDVALAAPIELVDRAISPAPSALRGIIQGLIRNAGSQSAGKSIKAAIGAWSLDIVKSILPSDDAAKKLVATSPKILPLTWIAVKITDSGLTTGWEHEFASRTGFTANTKITPSAFADQMFAERTAQRLLSELTGE